VNEDPGGVHVRHDVHEVLAWWLGIGSIIRESTNPRWVSPGSATRRMMVMATLVTPKARSRASTARHSPVVLQEVSFR